MSKKGHSNTVFRFDLRKLTGPVSRHVHHICGRLESRLAAAGHLPREGYNISHECAGNKITVIFDGAERVFTATATMVNSGDYAIEVQASAAA